ncbi:MAG: phosphate/phosphite/phosphonate ABC transporter substrate-binding protein [Thiogranum sp.]
MFVKSLISQLTRLLVFSLLLVNSAAAQEALLLGIHPYKSASKLIAAYTPLADYLAEKLRIPVEVRISRDYQAHIELIGADRLDIAYMGPASYITLVKHYGNKPLLARQAIHGKPEFRGVIIAPATSPLASLDQLRGKRFAFGDPNSTMSHLVPRYMLWKAGVDADDLGEYRFLGSHDNVALAVLAGDFDAGAVKEAVFQKYAERGLRALAVTPALSEHLFVTSSRLAPQRVEQLRNALLELNRTDNGRHIMNSIKPGITAMLPVQDSDYDNLRDIMEALRKLGIVK